MEICGFSFGGYRYNLDIYLYFPNRTLGNLYALFTGNNFSALLFHKKQNNVFYIFFNHFCYFRNNWTIPRKLSSIETIYFLIAQLSVRPSLGCEVSRWKSCLERQSQATNSESWTAGSNEEVKRRFEVEGYAMLSTKYENAKNS